MATLTQLTCEHSVDPLGIDVPQPRLSWKLQSVRRGDRQRAYQLLAASTVAGLSDSPLWDSGRVESDQSLDVVYTGPALTSGQRVYWRVRVWDVAGDVCESAPAWWEMGLLRPDDWHAQWIGAPFFGGPRTSSPPPYVRKPFTVRGRVASARLYATAIGLYECYLNDRRVGDDVFSPGWTDYTRRVQVQVYDVTDFLRPEVNALGAILGDGWGVGHVAWLGRQHYADRPRFLAQLVIGYADGSREIITTDDTWRTTQGPILESDMLMGESYDARRELAGWAQPGYDDSTWWPVEVMPDGGAARVGTNGPPMRRQESLAPVSTNPVPNLIRPRWIVDFGQNLVGWVRLRVTGSRGATVSLRFAEALNADGTLYTANLRTARNIDHYTLKGDGEEVWEPRFTFHGFRYVEIAGLEAAPTVETLTAIVIHSELPSIGAFACSDPLINQLQHNIVWGEKGNFIDVPTDCPQRDERLGWTGDAQVFVRTAAFNRDVAGFFTKWTRDLEDAQAAQGSYPAVAPNVPAWLIGPDGGPAWADAGVICPWTMYLCYGDRRLLEERYASMKRYVEFLARTSRQGLRCFADYAGSRGHGDWLALDGSPGREGGTSKELIGTAFYAHSSRLLAQIARILGRPADAARYEAYCDEALTAFVGRFVAADGTIEGGTQTAYVLALAFDLLPPDMRPAAVAELVRDIRARGDHLSTGFVGTPYITTALSEAGHLDVAYALLKQTTWPSWLYSVTQGATTIWERWDGWTHDRGFQDPKMNSFNHYAYGAIGAWLYAVVAGIDLDPEQPGYKHIIMRPRPGGGLTYATAELESPYGLIRSAWSLAGGRFAWEVVVPANATATVALPTCDPGQVTEGGLPLAEAEGVALVRADDGATLLHIGSGIYRFAGPLD